MMVKDAIVKAPDGSTGKVYVNEYNQIWSDEAIGPGGEKGGWVSPDTYSANGYKIVETMAYSDYELSGIGQVGEEVNHLRKLSGNDIPAISIRIKTKEHGGHGSTGKGVWFDTLSREAGE